MKTTKRPTIKSMRKEIRQLKKYEKQLAEGNARLIDNIQYMKEEKKEMIDKLSNALGDLQIHFGRNKDISDFYYQTERFLESKR